MFEAKLINACSEGNKKLVQNILSVKFLCNINACQNGQTPLIKAIEKGHLEIVKLLIDKGADVNTTISDKGRITPLHLAVIKGYTEIVKLLIDKGADVNASISGKGRATPLHLAVNNGRLDIVKELLATVANVNATDERGNTPLILAASNGHTDIVKSLIDKGADVNMTIKGRDSNFNDSALILAASEGYTEIVKLLIEQNAKYSESYKPADTIISHNNIIELYAQLTEPNRDNTPLETFRYNRFRVTFQYPCEWYPKVTDDQILVLPSKDAQPMPGSGGLYALSIGLMAAKKSDFKRSPLKSLNKFIETSPSKFNDYDRLFKKKFQLSSGQDAIEFIFNFSKQTEYGLSSMRVHGLISICEDLLFVLDVSGQSHHIKNRHQLWQKIVQSLCFE